MFLYLAIFTIVALFAFLESYMVPSTSFEVRSNSQKRILEMLVVIILSIVSGTRLLGGTDYIFYQNAYENVPTISYIFLSPELVSSNFWLAGLDKGYLIIISLLKTVGVSFAGYCLLQAIFFHVSVYAGFKRYCDNVSFVFLIFLGKTFFYDTFISMRQSITIAIFFLALPLIEKKKPIQYFFIALICAFIHAGALIMLPVYLVNYIDISREKFKYLLFIFMPFAILNFLKINFLYLFSKLILGIFGMFSDYWAMKANAYLSNMGDSLSGFYIVEYLLIAVLLLSCGENFFRDDKSLFELKMFSILWPLYTFFGGIGIITREKDYFILFYGVIIYRIMQCKIKNKGWILVGTISLMFFEFWRYIFLFDQGSLLEYSSWLFK